MTQQAPQPVMAVPAPRSIALDMYRGAIWGDFDAQEIVRSTGHQKTLPQLGMSSYSRLEPVEIVLRLAVQRDVDDNGNAGLDVRGVHQGGIAADDAGLFHQFYPP